MLIINGTEVEDHYYISPAGASGIKTSLDLINLMDPEYINGSVVEMDPAASGLSLQCSQVARFYIHFVCSGSLSVIGIIANIISIIVIGRDRETTPVVALLLRALAIADSFFLIMFILTHSLEYLFSFAGVEVVTQASWLYFRLYVYPLLFTGQMGTIWLTVLIAACRFIFVCLPYDVHKYCSYKIIHRSIWILVICCFLYNLPRYFEAKVYTSMEGNISKRYLNLTVMGDSQTYRKGYFNVSYYLFCFFLPLLLLIIFNTGLIVAYRKKQKIRKTICKNKSQQKSQGRERQEQNITLIMIVVILLFVCCLIPARLIQMLYEYKTQTCPSPEFFLMELSTVLEVLNSSVNFFIYFVFRRAFRQTLQKMFCPSMKEFEVTTEMHQAHTEESLLVLHRNDVTNAFTHGGSNNKINFHD